MADCDQCRDGDCPRCDVFTCSCTHDRECPEDNLPCSECPDYCLAIYGGSDDT